MAFAEEVPIQDRFTAGYGGEVARVGAAILLNQMLLNVTGRFSGPSTAPWLRDWIDVARARRRPDTGLLAPNRAAQGHIPMPPVAAGLASGAAGAPSQLFPIDVSEYLALFASIPTPELVEKFGRLGEFQDRAFAWQRVAGANPMVLSRVQPKPQGTNGPPSLDEAVYRRVVGGEDSLGAAIAEGRLYVADYRLLDQLPPGAAPEGLKKYSCTPTAWFAALPATRRRPGRFVPIAIQCSQAASKPILFQPGDGTKWLMARTTVQTADANLQEMVYHLGRTHIVMEAVVLSARRNLAANHPLMVLLEPHFEFTLAINDYASRHLIAPNGEVDRLLASTLEGSLTLTARALDELELRQLAPPVDFACRGVEDREALPDYPYRDDALLVWGAIRRFVARYVGVYYRSAEDVVLDGELAAFRAALLDPDQGGLKGLGPIETIDALVEFIASLVFTASAQHSALNYAQFPCMGFVPNAPAALYAPPPSDTTKDDIAEWLRMLPPVSLALPQFTLLYQLSAVRWNRLGHYSPLQFLDCRVWEALLRFRWDLDSVEAQILAADADRFLSYPFLLPSQLGNSVFI